MPQCRVDMLVALTVAWSVACAEYARAQTSTTNRKEPTTSKSLSEQALKLWQRDIDQYRLHTKDPEALRRRAEEFIKTVQLNILPYPQGPRFETTAAMGKKLIEDGCQDVLVRTYYGKAVVNDEGPYAALRILTEALNSWPSSDYPPECRRMGVFTIFGDIKRYARALQWSHMREEAAQHAAFRVKDETLGPEMRRVLFHELMPLIDCDDIQTTWEDPIAIYEACAALPKADPWLLHMLSGGAFVGKAWRDRGGGWANKVTPEGWQSFSLTVYWS
jgi:hypothetical protein